MDKYSGASLYHGFEIRRSHRDNVLPDVMTQFATLLLESMRSKFPKLELWDALSIFHPNTFPSTVTAKAKFGKQNFASLLAHYINMVKNGEVAHPRLTLIRPNRSGHCSKTICLPLQLGQWKTIL